MDNESSRREFLKSSSTVLAAAAIPYLPPGTLPPVVLPFDPTSTTPVCLVALDSDSDDENMEAILAHRAKSGSPWLRCQPSSRRTNLIWCRQN